MPYFFIVIWALFSFPLHADDEERLLIEDRIKPIGQVHIQKDPNAKAVTDTKAPVTKTAAVSKGQEIYEQYCLLCHRDGVANAPKFQSKTDWEPRLKAAGSIDGLVSIAEKGMNVMPPKGTCQNCTSQDLKLAIEYMLPRHE